MVVGIARSAPDAGNAKLATSTLHIVVWAVDLAPGVTSSSFDYPAMAFSDTQCLFYFLV
jgi:hypothetical protein